MFQSVFSNNLTRKFVKKDPNLQNIYAYLLEEFYIYHLNMNLKIN